MTLAELLSGLRERNVHVWSTEGQLLYSAPRGSIDSHLRAALAVHKKELIDILVSGSSPSEPAEEPVSLTSDSSTSVRWFTTLAELLGDSTELGPERRRGLEMKSDNADVSSLRGWEAPALSLEQEDYYLDYLRGRTTRKIALGVEIRGPCRQEVLRQTIAELIRRHEALRTRIGVVGGQVCQLIDGPNCRLEWGDLSGYADEQGALERERRLGAQVRLNIEQGPIFWSKLLRVNVDTHVLLMTVSHIALDGWSLASLFEEFVVLYSAFTDGALSPLDSPGVRYVDYSVRSRKRLQGDKINNHREYWRQQLLTNVSPRVQLPTDRPRGQSIPTTASLRLDLEADLVLLLKEACVRAHTTGFCALLGALGVVIAQCTGAEDVSVASTFANRDVGFESVVGLCATPVNLRLNLFDNPLVSEFLARTHDTVFAAQAHQGVPPHRVLEEAGNPSLAQTVHCPAFFLLLNYPRPWFRGVKMNVQMDPLPPIPGLNVDASDVLAENEDLAMILNEGEGGTISGFIHYRADLFELKRIQKFAQNFKRVLGFFALQPLSRISEIHYQCLVTRA